MGALTNTTHSELIEDSELTRALKTCTTLTELSLVNVMSNFRAEILRFLPARVPTCQFERDSDNISTRYFWAERVVEMSWEEGPGGRVAAS